MPNNISEQEQQAGVFVGYLKVIGNPEVKGASVYLDNGELKVFVDGKRINSIKGLDPRKRFTQDEAKSLIAQVNVSLRVFGKRGDYTELDILPTGPGGWGTHQHKGYRPGLFTPRVVVWYSEAAHQHPGEGTFIWGRRNGFALHESVQIARACEGVDYGNTNPMHIGSRYAQSYHFSVLGFKTGTLGDTRLVHSVRHLARAISLWNGGNRNGALDELGKGLHPLEDVFAHTDLFAAQSPSAGYFHHAGPNGIGADDPTFINPQRSVSSQVAGEGSYNQRYSDAKTAAYMYMHMFRLATRTQKPTNIPLDDIFSRIVNTQAFKGFFETLRLFATAPSPVSDQINTLMSTALQPDTVVLPQDGQVLQNVVAALDQVRLSPGRQPILTGYLTSALPAAPVPANAQILQCEPTVAGLLDIRSSKGGTLIATANGVRFQGNMLIGEKLDLADLRNSGPEV